LQLEDLLRGYRRIYFCTTNEVAKQRLRDFEAAWGKVYRASRQCWRRHWPRWIPFFDDLPAVGKMI